MLFGYISLVLLSTWAQTGGEPGLFGEEGERAKGARSSVYNVTTCSADWLEMNDTNFADIVNRYRRCLNLVRRLSGEEKTRYESKMGENLITSCKLFLKKTTLPPTGLVRVARSVARMLSPFINGEDDAEIEQQDSVEISTENQQVLSTAAKAKTTVNSTESPVDTIEEKSNATAGNATLKETDIAGEEKAGGTCPGTEATQCQKSGSCKDKRKLYELFILAGFMILIFAQLILLVCLVHKCITYCKSPCDDCALGVICPDMKSMQEADVYHSNVIRGEMKTEPRGHFEISKTPASELSPTTSTELAAPNTPASLQYHAQISTALSSISSSELGSDSEFEALMRRRPLLEKKTIPRNTKR